MVDDAADGLHLLLQLCKTSLNVLERRLKRFAYYFQRQEAEIHEPRWHTSRSSELVELGQLDRRGVGLAEDGAEPVVADVGGFSELALFLE